MSYILPRHLPKWCVPSLGGMMFFLLLRFWKDSGDRDFITVETVPQQFSPGDLRTKKKEFKECSHINVRKVLCFRIQAYLCDKQSCVLVINFSFNNRGISFLYCCDSSLLSMLSFAPMLFYIPVFLIFSDMAVEWNSRMHLIVPDFLECCSLSFQKKRFD